MTSDGSWPHCDGTSVCPMPMPSERCVLKQEPQPSLLEERRVWVKKDRAVKLDIFLSIHDDIKTDVFGVGPPLPPSALTAKEMMEALDQQFSRIPFNFEDYHHTFCRFLNLHLDDFVTLDEFNDEFRTLLQEMEDFGHPLNNIQACSAYFSKLRCCQNPWVANHIREWHAAKTPPKLDDLMKEAPAWLIVRPLAIRPSRANLRDDDNSNNTGPVEEEIIVHASVEALVESRPPPPKNPSRSSRGSRSSMMLQDRPLPPLPPDEPLSPRSPQSPSRRAPPVDAKLPGSWDLERWNLPLQGVEELPAALKVGGERKRSRAR